MSSSKCRRSDEAKSLAVRGDGVWTVNSAHCLSANYQGYAFVEMC